MDNLYCILVVQILDINSMNWEERFFTGRKATVIAFVLIALWAIGAIVLGIQNIVTILK